MGTGGIYEIVNTVNGKRYIGSAVNFKKRFREHRRDLMRNDHHSIALQRAWNKYGEDAFQFLPMMTVEDSTKLIWWEQRFFDALKPEYNICLVAGSSLGVKLTPEHRAKISAGNIGRVPSVETRALISKANKGREKSAAEIANISAGKRGKPGHPHTQEFRANLSDRNRGNKYAIGNKNALGLKHTPEYCAAISTRQIGVPLTDAHRAAIGAGNRGKTRSAETRAKLSEWRTGKKNPAVSAANKTRISSPETCAKRSVSATGKKQSPETIAKRAKTKHLNASYKRLMEYAWAGA